MPELPEVEVTRRGIAPHLVGQQIQRLDLGKPLRWPLGCTADHLVGRRVAEVGRRSKYLLLGLDAGWLIVHLGMSGRLAWLEGATPQSHPAGPHDHMDLWLDRGLLRLHDPRRFGAVIYAPSLEDPVARKLLDHLGPEPLSEAFSFDAFRQALRTSRAAIKPLLLGGRLVVGVGNIYASEALFMAGILPTTLACDIGDVRARKLYDAVREVLARAVELGGSTLKDYMRPDGTNGNFQHEALVYGRAGEPCRRCGQAVSVMRQGQRSTFFCTGCQKP